KKIKPRTVAIKRVFVFFGGSDPHNLTGMALQALSKPELASLEADIVIGENNPHKVEICELIKARENIHLHIQVDDISSIMAKADFAIGSGGVNTWERMCLGLFSMVITTADNQIHTVENLSAHKYIKYLGDHKIVSQSCIGVHIQNYVSKMTGNDRNILPIDGLGTNKIARHLRNGMKPIHEK
ncbi:UDP-2,4-diacetamido-2,4,6-trideoxy-beta-L-altropyranose hydrolase, partial [Verrucomicrobia bacterium]|nr:UDP-2,4-diacetamido-2,4,6-trideoxy-beta-L-altropyranose hydrolase [Verrucomicrobiota bacterium]